MASPPRGVAPTAGAERRLLSVLVLWCVLTASLLGRSVYLKTVRAGHFRELGERYRRSQKVETPLRGNILDRNGNALALTEVRPRVEFDEVAYRRVWKERRRGHVSAAARLLASVLGMEPGDVEQRMFGEPNDARKHFNPRQRLIKDGVTLAEREAVLYIARRARTREGRPVLAGIAVNDYPTRRYPAGDTSAPLLGRTVLGTVAVMRGMGGIEDHLDPVLAGTIGWHRQAIDASGLPNKLKPGRRAEVVQGMDLNLTLDMEVQRICAEELDQCMHDHTPLGATAIVVDVKTGDILGMVSRPSLDLSTAEAGSQLLANPELMRNRALMPYEPGSVMKPITVAIGLDTGVIHDNECIPCETGFKPKSRVIRCEAHRRGLPAPGTNVPRMIVAKSCNVATAKIALRLGATRLHAGLTRFGLLERTGVGLPGDAPGRSRTAPALIKQRLSGPDDIARVGFGQSVTVTPLALVAAFAAIGNDGVLVKPRLLVSYGYPGVPPARVYPEPERRRAISVETARLVRSYLGSVVQKGTGKAAAIPGYTTGGKTGTAQKVVGGGYHGYIASFAGLAPLSNPRVAIIVVVDEPQNGYHGSQAAAPTWGRIALRLMNYLRVRPDAPSGAVYAASTPTGDVGD